MTDEAVSAEPGRADARANRLRVLHAAREVFREQGQDAEMRAIAQRAGVGLATIYRRFGNKDGLLLVTAEQTRQDFLDLLRRAEATADPVEGLCGFLTSAVAFVHAHGPLFEIFAGHSGGTPRRLPVEVSAGLHRLISRGIESGDYTRHVNVTVAVHMILSSLVSMAHAHEAPPDLSAEDFTAAILALLTGGQEQGRASLTV